MSSRTHNLVLAALLSSLPCIAACGDAKVATAAMESAIDDPAACREEHPEGVVAFVVGPDGGVRAGATGADGKPAKIESGALTFRKEGGDPVESKLAPEGDGSTASAKGPPLDGSVTAMDYAVQVGGKTLKGVLHLPSGGTKALSEGVKTSAAEEAPGPNGGQVQTVAGEPVEVAVAPSGDVAAYVLDRDRKVVITPGRTLWVLIDGEKVPLTQREDGAFIGRTRVSAPHKVTIVVVRDGKVHLALVGHRPGLKIVANRAPGRVVVKEIAPGKGPVDKNPDEPGMGHAKGKEKRDGDGADDDDHGKDKDKDKGKQDKVDGPDRNKGAGNDKGGGKGKK